MAAMLGAYLSIKWPEERKAAEIKARQPREELRRRRGEWAEV